MTDSVPLVRGCTQAFSHLDSAALALFQTGGAARLLSDAAYQSLIRALVGSLPNSTANPFPVNAMPNGLILPKSELLAVFYAVANFPDSEERRTWEISAAAASGYADQHGAPAMHTLPC